ncbi:MAG: 3-dehydroquinate synthase [Chloroflexi bacterium]|nr:3-dehydroquinate synthase [Chloroflexota bacterium]
MTTRNRIYLIGFSGAGKSAVGRSTARLLGWRFEDADERIVERAGKPVERVFAEDGEPAFRELERATIAEFAREEHVVVSTGAGSVMHDQSLGGMLSSGLVVALEARPETVYRRLSHIAELDGAEAMTRPMLQSDDPLGRIESLKRERQWAYAHAHWTVHTDDLSIEQAALEVVRAWRRLGAPSAWEDDPDFAATVRLEQGAYPVFVGWDSLEDQLGRRLAQMGLSGRAFIVCDSNVVHPYGRAAQRSLHAAGIEMGLFTFPAGEASKNLATATVLYEWLAERRAERRDAIVAVGGGVVGDLAGYVAATFLRGIRVVQVPTSLTAMVDSSIGGKTGVDLPVAKNMVGAFHHPAMVLTDVSALRTLPERALREGWAEAVKHGLALEAGLVDLYEEHADALQSLDPELTTRAVAWNAAVKARMVSADEREMSGLRQLLNYGHTIGHGLEAAAGYDAYLHGEAVAIGMTGAARLGMLEGVTPPELVERQASLIARFGLPSAYMGVEPEAILEAMSRDKKTTAGQISWVLLDGVGSSRTHRGIAPERVASVVRELGA